MAGYQLPLDLKSRSTFDDRTLEIGSASSPPTLLHKMFVSFPTWLVKPNSVLHSTECPAHYEEVQRPLVSGDISKSKADSCIAHQRPYHSVHHGPVALDNSMLRPASQWVITSAEFLAAIDTIICEKSFKRGIPQTGTEEITPSAI